MHSTHARATLAIVTLSCLAFTACGDSPEGGRSDTASSADPINAARDRAWSADEVPIPSPMSGAVAEVPAVRLETFDPTRPGRRPNPFIASKEHLSAEDTRAGVDAPPGLAR